MSELGWVDGKDYIVDARYAEAVGANVSRVAQDVVSARPDVILTPGDSAVRALAKATKTIPIVFATVGDPLAYGAVKSLQRPGGNITGLGTLQGPLAAKRLELLKQAFPRVTHISALYSPEEGGTKLQLDAIERAATALGIRLTRSDMEKAGLKSAIREAAAAGCQAVVVLDGYVINSNQREIVASINAARLPGMFSRAEHVEAGGLISYASSTVDNFRRAATYVDKILKGAKPGDLPIEEPAKFELTINLKTAKAIGAAIPTSLLVRADKVIQ